MIIFHYDHASSTQAAAHQVLKARADYETVPLIALVTADNASDLNDDMVSAVDKAMRLPTSIDKVLEMARDFLNT